MRPRADDTDLACAKVPSSRKYRRRRLPLPRPVLRGTAVEVMIVLIGQIRGQRVVLNRIGGDPSQRRLFRLALKRLDLNDEGLIRPEVEWLVWDDGLAIKMCVDRHDGSS